MLHIHALFKAVQNRTFTQNISNVLANGEMCKTRKTNQIHQSCLRPSEDEDTYLKIVPISFSLQMSSLHYHIRDKQ